MRYTAVLRGWHTIRSQFLVLLAVLEVNRQFCMALNLVMAPSTQTYSSFSDTRIPSTLIHEDILHTRFRAESKKFMWNHPTPLFKRFFFPYFQILFTSTLDLELRKKLVKCYILEHSFIWCWNLDPSGSRSETPGKFWNMVLEEDGKDQLDWSCEKWRSIA